jgi:hypothetical protein
MANDMTEASALIFAQAQKQLQQQVTDLDALRNRAVALLSVAALVAGLFGSRLPKGQSPAHTTFGTWVALAAFAAGVFLALTIAIPRRKWLFTFRLDQLAELVEKRTAIPADITHNLTRWSEEARRWNSARLDRLHALFGCLCLAVGIQVIAWGVAAL